MEGEQDLKRESSHNTNGEGCRLSLTGFGSPFSIHTPAPGQWPPSGEYRAQEAGGTQSDFNVLFFCFFVFILGRGRKMGGRGGSVKRKKTCCFRPSASEDVGCKPSCLMPWAQKWAVWVSVALYWPEAC